jgi:hypothetical protein
MMSPLKENDINEDEPARHSLAIDHRTIEVVDGRLHRIELVVFVVRSQRQVSVDLVVRRQGARDRFGLYRWQTLLHFSVVHSNEVQLRRVRNESSDGVLPLEFEF